MELAPQLRGGPFVRSQSLYAFRLSKRVGNFQARPWLLWHHQDRFPMCCRKHMLRFQSFFWLSTLPEAELLLCCGALGKPRRFGFWRCEDGRCHGMLCAAQMEYRGLGLLHSFGLRGLSGLLGLLAPFAFCLALVGRSLLLGVPAALRLDVFMAAHGDRDASLRAEEPRGVRGEEGLGHPGGRPGRGGGVPPQRGHQLRLRGTAAHPAFRAELEGPEVRGERSKRV